jgi:hypothetical protein
LRKKMSHLKISILEGKTVEGRTEYEFPSDKTVVTLGRDPEHCDIVFDDSLRSQGVGNEHLSLRRSLGRYELDLNTKNYVAVDGRPAFEGQEITGEAVLDLDRGARVRAEIVQDRAETIAQQKAGAQPGRLAARNRVLVVTALAVALALAGVVWVNSLRIGGIDADIEKASDVSERILERTAEATYLVLVKNSEGGESAVGTAWVATDGGVPKVVTNAHVAEIRDGLTDGQQLYIRSSKAPEYREHRVVAHRIHPGYERFRALTASYEPIVESAQGGQERIQQIDAADVALLEVEQAELLEPPLTVLPESELQSLRTGMEVAYVGYPTENMVPGNLRRPTPVTQKDELIAVTDFFLVRHNDGENRLVQHALPSTGGASGSPIVDSHGRVVAVLSAGNVVPIQGGRFPLAVDVNFAQRVDFVHDLLEDRADRATERYVLQWQEGLAAFDSLPEIALVEALERILGLLGHDRVPEPRTIRAELPPADGGPATARHDLGTMENAVVLVRAVPSMPADLDLALAANNTGVAVDEAYSQSALVDHRVSGRQSLEVEIRAASRLDEDSAVPYTMEIYRWSMAEVPYARLAENMAISATRQAIGTSEDPQLILEERATLSEKPIPPLDVPLVQRELQAQVDGVYLFLAYPREGGEDIDLLLADASGQLLGRDVEYRPEAYVQVALSAGDTVQMLAAHSQRGGIPIALRVYRW